MIVPGDTVTVKRWPRARRKVVALYSDVPGGVRLDRPVAGFVSWNVDALRKVR